MMAYAKPQPWKKEGSERLRGEGNKIKSIDLRLERGQVGGKGEGQMFHKLHTLGMNDDLWDSARGLGNLAL